MLLRWVLGFVLFRLCICFGLTCNLAFCRLCFILCFKCLVCATTGYVC